MRAAILGIAFVAQMACQKEMSPRAEELYQEELAKLSGEAWPALNSDSFTQLEMGSSYGDAVALMGPGEEVSRSEAAGQSIVVYQWMRPDGGNISLTYNNDALVSKAQAGFSKVDPGSSPG